METVRLLVECHGADLEARDDHGKTALVWAAANGQLQAADYLVSKGAKLDLSGSDNRYRTAAAWASQNGFADVAEMLAAHGADLAAKDEVEKTPMLLAACRGRWEVVAVLAARGVEVPPEHRAAYQESAGKIMIQSRCGEQGGNANRDRNKQSS